MVAVQSAVIVDADAVDVPAGIAIPVTLMMRGNRLIRSKGAQVVVVPSTAARWATPACVSW